MSLRRKRVSQKRETMRRDACSCILSLDCTSASTFRLILLLAYEHTYNVFPKNAKLYAKGYVQLFLWTVTLQLTYSSRAATPDALWPNRRQAIQFTAVIASGCWNIDCILSGLIKSIIYWGFTQCFINTMACTEDISYSHTTPVEILRYDPISYSTESTWWLRFWGRRITNGNWGSIFCIHLLVLRRVDVPTVGEGGSGRSWPTQSGNYIKLSCQSNRIHRGAWTHDNYTTTRHSLVRPSFCESVPLEWDGDLFQGSCRKLYMHIKIMEMVCFLGHYRGEKITPSNMNKYQYSSLQSLPTIYSYMTRYRISLHQSYFRDGIYRGAYHHESRNKIHNYSVICTAMLLVKSWIKL